MPLPSYFATNASDFSLSPLSWDHTLDHSSEGRKGWDEAVEDSRGTGPRRKLAQNRRA